MSKTFWSVQYSVLGAPQPLVAWFDNKEDVAEFAKRDYTDKPIRHTYGNADKIKQAEELVNITQFNINY